MYMGKTVNTAPTDKPQRNRAIKICATVVVVAIKIQPTINGIAAPNNTIFRPIRSAKNPAIIGPNAAANANNDDIHDFSVNVICRSNGLSVSQLSYNFGRQGDVHVKTQPALKAIKLPRNK